VRLSWQRRRLHTHFPFRTARELERHDLTKEVLLVRIDHGGHSGWGEAAPVSYYHQTLDSAEQALTQIQPLLGDDPFLLDAILDRLWQRFSDQPATIAAIDGALHDLIGRVLDVPVWRLLGLDPTSAPLTSFTIGIDELEVMAEKVRQAESFPILKVKVGTDRDEAVLEMIRREAGDKTVRVDANCAWSEDLVADRCRRLARYDLELIEQPTAAGDHEGLPAVRRMGIAPLIADESCLGVEDVLACVGAFDGINIKLCKCGGMRRALQMIHTARSAGMKVMLGCMVETSVGIAAAAQLAPLADYIDLDGHMLLADDPFEGIGGGGGRLTLTDAPGLGLRQRA
jgi:L-alanine-DL-glutamate epimerase-like enolase superfamily enzyme